MKISSRMATLSEERRLDGVEVDAAGELWLLRATLTRTLSGSGSTSQPIEHTSILITAKNIEEASSEFERTGDLTRFSQFGRGPALVVHKRKREEFNKLGVAAQSEIILAKAPEYISDDPFADIRYVEADCDDIVTYRRAIDREQDLIITDIRGKLRPFRFLGLYGSVDLIEDIVGVKAARLMQQADIIKNERNGISLILHDLSEELLAGIPASKIPSWSSLNAAIIAAIGEPFKTEPKLR